jgi:hypothetical protein
MGPINDPRRKDKVARKKRNRTADAVDLKDLTDLSRLPKTAGPVIAMGMDKESLMEWVNVVYGDMKRDKRLSRNERLLLLGIFYNLGNVGEACYQTKISMSNHYYWMKTNPIYKDYFDMVGDNILDLMEITLIDMAVKDRNFNAVKFYLESKGGKRGYSKEALISQTITPTQFILKDVEPSQHISDRIESATIPSVTVVEDLLTEIAVPIEPTVDGVTVGGQGPNLLDSVNASEEAPTNND